MENRVIDFLNSLRNKKEIPIEQYEDLTFQVQDLELCMV